MCLAPERFTQRDMLPRVGVSAELRVELKDLMQKRELTQKDLAEKLNRSQGSISMILSGSRRGDALEILEELAGVFEVPLSELVHRAEVRSDLTRHTRIGASPPHPLRGADDTAMARLREQNEKLVGQVVFYKKLLGRMRKLTGHAYHLLGGENDPVEPIESRSGKTRRRTG